ncbi:MAG: glycosyltransferase family protein [Bacteroidota bacterium]|nr:glycosyltransferase family protein [Bacteroidota bacterium]
MNMKIVTIIQARTSSTRLPKKVLMPLAGKTALSRLVERVMASKLSGEIVVATTTESNDNPIRELCLLENFNCFSGHPIDLLDRHYKAASKFKADIVVKIPSDCPLIDPDIIDSVLEFYMHNYSDFDYVSNLHPATFPDGNDVEVMSISTLRTAWKEAKKNFEREHATPFIWENRQRFRIGNITWDKGLDFSMTHRFTLDYIEDYQFISKVYDELYENNPLFGLNEILELLERKPEIALINNKYLGVNWYRHHLSELKTIKPSETNLKIVS